MNQKRATSIPSLFEAAEAGTTNSPTSITCPSYTGHDGAAGKSKRGSSKQYIPVYRIELVRERTNKVEPRRAVYNSDDVVAILQDELLKADSERLICLMLNAKNVIIGMDFVSVGTLTQSCAHPRELYKAAILSNAATIILVHNHPSGDPSPSLEDAQLTARISKAGEILGIKLLDHVIIGELGSYSFANAGRLP
ncbi:MAG: JAB domain-containing protein [Acidobacteriota bacterium]